jgi:hypothetical protein
VALACTLTAQAAASQTTARPPAERARAESAAVLPRTEAIAVTGRAPDIDGTLSEAEWGAAPVATGFMQFVSTAGVASSERTEARVVYDDEALYVALAMHDGRVDSIAAPLARRDDDVYSDWAYAEIAAPDDRRTAMVFGVNPRGVKWDGVYHDDIVLDASPDAVWTAAARRQPWGWTAELRIPLSQLPGRARNGQPLRVNFRRRIARRDEMANWSPIRRGSGRHVSLFGELSGLRDVDPPGRVEVRPYSVARVISADVAPDDPFRQPAEWGGDAGVDVRYAVAPRLVLTATINPDFGQVEADPSVVNLSAYQTFFPEKRPFFLEDAAIFGFPLGNTRLLHSRRIGRYPQRVPRAPGGFVDVPRESTILGAARLTGHADGGWSVGAIGAITAAESASVQDTTGVARTEPVEPLTGYGVARVRKSFRDGNSEIGAMMTAVQRKLPASGELDALRSSALAGGFDVRHRFLRSFEVQAMWSASRVAGSPAAILATQRSPEHYFQRADAEHIELDPTATELTGHAGGLSLRRVAGTLLWGLEARAVSPGFEVNDAGFQRQADVISQTAFLTLDRQLSAGRGLRRFRLGVSGGADWTFGRERLSRRVSVDTRLDFRQYSGLTASIAREMDGVSADATRGGPSLVTPGRFTVSAGVFTDTRKPLRFRVDGSAAREDETGGYRWRLRGGVDLGLSAYARLSLLASLTRNLNHWQHTGNRTTGGVEHYVFARLRQTTVDATVRADILFTPDVSLQFYAQPFLDSRLYDDFREVIDPTAPRFDARFRDFSASAVQYDPVGRTYGLDIDGDGASDASFRNPDYAFRQLRSNVVLRWEYRPGSTAFLIWTHERTGTDTDRPFLLDRDLARLFGNDPGAPGPTNIILLKLSYWLGF